MTKSIGSDRDNAIVQVVKTYGQGVEAAAKRIAMEVEMRKRAMGPVPDPTPRDFAETISGDSSPGNLAAHLDRLRPKTNF